MKRRSNILSTVFGMFILLAPLFTKAQEKKSLSEGNKLYKEKKYPEAEKSYRQALSKNKDSYKAIFNLGDAFYQQGKYDEAAEQFQKLSHIAASKDTLARIYHNLGNSLLKAKKYKESIDAFKNALRNNPDDEDTRYNLAYAMQMLKQQQQQQNKDNKDNKDKKDQDKKDQKKKDKPQEKKDNKDQQKKEKQDQSQISKEDAQRLLDALQNDEKELQGKVKKGQKKGIKVQIEKDW